jgi:hypothetical protein
VGGINSTISRYGRLGMTRGLSFDEGTVGGVKVLCRRESISKRNC